MIRRLFNELYNAITEQSIFYRVVLLVVVLWSVALSFIAQTIGAFFFLLALYVVVVVVCRNQNKYIGYFSLALLLTTVCAIVIFYLQTAITGSNVMFKDTGYYAVHINDLVSNFRAEYLVANNNVAEAYKFFDIIIPQTGYIYVVGTITKVFCGQPNMIFYLVVVTSFSSLLVLMSAKLAEVVTHNEKIVKVSAIISLIYPHFLLFSGVLLKDILCALIIVCIAYNIITIQKNTIRKCIFTVLLLGYLLFVRYRLGIVLIPICILMFILPKNDELTVKSVFKSIVKRWFVVLVFLICSAVLYMYCYDGSSEISGAMVNDVSSITSEEAENPSGMLKYALQTEAQTGNASIEFLDIIYKIPPVLRQIFVFCFILVYPFNFYSSFAAPMDKIVESVFMDIGTLFWLICLPLFVVGIYAIIKRKYNNQIIYFVLAIIAVMAIVMYVHIRWKLMAWPFIAIITAIGLVHRKEHRKLYIAAIIGMIFLAGAYLALALIV